MDHLSIIYLQSKTWTDTNCNITLYQLPNYKLFHQGNNAVTMEVYLHMYTRSLMWNPQTLHFNPQDGIVSV